MDTISSSVERITYYNTDSGYTVLAYVQKRETDSACRVRVLIA
jgi:hypothetical protein